MLKRFIIDKETGLDGVQLAMLNRQKDKENLLQDDYYLKDLFRPPPEYDVLFSEDDAPLSHIDRWGVPPPPPL